jgi:hypothetical protein
LTGLRLDLWFGLAGTLEALDQLVREFFDATSDKDEITQNTLLAKVREQVQGLTDKKEQKRYVPIIIC